MRALRADGCCFRWWETTVERADTDAVVTLSPPGSYTHDEARGSWTLQHYLRTYYWFDRFYNLIVMYRPDGTLAQIYVNIGSPPVLTDGGFDWTDHELDVSKLPGEPARLVDEDEFAEAAQRYGYTPEFQIRCYAAAHEALALAEAWRPAGLSAG